MLILIDYELDDQRWENSMMENRIQEMVMKKRFADIVRIIAKSFQNN